MKQEIQLSDLLMMQMVGGLEEYISLATSHQDTKTHVSRVKDLATTPELFEDIIRKTMSTQFGDPLTALRELGQNARDSYEPSDREKRIEFLSEDIGGEQWVAVRDYGVGMQPHEVLSLFLIPYNSSKEFDLAKIGEHGIGFFGNFDISKKILVKTRKGAGLTTALDMTKEGQDWNVTYDFSDEDFVGTEVSMKLSKTISEPNIYSTLIKNLGFLDASFVVSYNGEKVNTLSESYSEMGYSNIQNKGVTGPLQIGMAEKDSFDTTWPTSLVMTQNGLYIKDPPVSGLLEDEVLTDFVARMMSIGYNFQIGLPGNIGLTKGRNDIIANDYALVRKAATQAFSQGILEKIVEDKDLAYELDTQLADFVERILDMVIHAKKTPKREHRVRDTTSYADPMPGTSIGSLISTLEEESILVRNKRHTNAYNLQKVFGFSQELLQKKLIPGKLYERRKTEKVRVSVVDVIDFYCADLLHMEPEQPTKGLVVDGDNPIISKVIDHLMAQQAPKKTPFMHRLKRMLSGGVREFLSGFKELFSPVQYVPIQAFQRPISYDFDQKNRKAFKKMAARYGEGKEYLALFDNISYIDELVSKANNIKPAKVRLIGQSRGYKSIVAQTTYRTIQFNVYNPTVKNYIGSIRRGSYTEQELGSLVELIIHEKSHDVMGIYNVSATHGHDFYSRTKKRLREKMYEHCRREHIDPMNEVNQDLKPITTPALSPQRLHELL